MENKEFRTEEQKVEYAYDTQHNLSQDQTQPPNEQSRCLCKECGESMSKDAIRCPHCGKTNPEKSNKTATLGMIFSFFFIYPPLVFSVVSLVLSLVGLFKSFKTKTNMGKAITGLAISSTVILTTIIVAICLPATQGSSTATLA